ncbi:hypothetical protein CLU97_1199 [Chryseobacterium sp. 7]|uniref:hypothetical protein n=1 Tax=Chryseobacterium sp. 7 TaxID=2035214 RepID=UPI000F1D2F26|nr:hypothetical protein [Chryseobacterium sp. 7]RLJ31760.1 hypothetical protein CLU97_1199 [Chryseobacterium sp. 7]
MANDHKTFNIYNPSKNFVWTRSRIIWVLMIFSLVSIFFVLNILKIPEKQIPQWLGCSIFTPMILGFLVYMINIWFPEELKGKIDGKLIFEIDKITINNEILFTKDIKRIQISISDYKKKFIRYNQFDGAFSQGCKNELIIILLNNQKKSCFFQIQQPKETLQMVNQLDHYTKMGLLTKEEENNILNYNW